MMLEKKNTGTVDDEFFKCPFCTCRFASKLDLDDHLRAWGTDKVEHLRQLDRAHRGVDRSFRGTMAKNSKDERSTKAKVNRSFR